MNFSEYQNILCLSVDMKKIWIGKLFAVAALLLLTNFVMWGGCTFFLAGKLIREGDPEVKIVMEGLLKGEVYHTTLDEQIVFDQLDYKGSAVWSMLLASGYLRADSVVFDVESGRQEYNLSLTNREVRSMFEEMIRGWFRDYTPAYNGFVNALLKGNLRDRKSVV